MLPLVLSCLSMFNFSANHLFLLSRTEYRSCAVFTLLDRDTQRVYRLFDFTKRLRLMPNRPYCVAGNVYSASTLYLVMNWSSPTLSTSGFPTLHSLLTARKGRACTDPLRDLDPGSHGCSADFVIAAPAHRYPLTTKPAAKMASKPA